MIGIEVIDNELVLLNEAAAEKNSPLRYSMLLGDDTRWLNEVNTLTGEVKVAYTAPDDDLFYAYVSLLKNIYLLSGKN